MTLKQRVAQMKKLFGWEEKYPMLIGPNLGKRMKSGSPARRGRKRARPTAAKAKKGNSKVIKEEKTGSLSGTALKRRVAEMKKRYGWESDFPPIGGRSIASLTMFDGPPRVRRKRAKPASATATKHKSRVAKKK